MCGKMQITEAVLRADDPVVEDERGYNTLLFFVGRWAGEVLSVFYSLLLRVHCVEVIAVWL